jgi:hypothetical protein
MAHIITPTNQNAIVAGQTAEWRAKVARGVDAATQRAAARRHATRGRASRR